VDFASEQPSYTDGDVDTNNSGNRNLWDLAQERYTRRETMSGLAATGAAFMGAGLLAGCEGGPDSSDDPEQIFTVNAGADATTSSGRVVTLSGGVTSGPVQPIGFTQTGGPAVTLTNAGSNNPSFIAPAVNAPTTLTFQFQGRNLAGALVTDEVVVTVNPPELGFTAVPKNKNDIVTVPDGYTLTILYRTGDPILQGVPAYRNDGTDTNFAGRSGDHHDGMYYFGLNSGGTARQDSGSDRGLLAVNHENITVANLHPAGPTNISSGARPAAEALKEMEAHGVSVVEVQRGSNGVWGYNQNSAFNFRVTPITTVDFAGPLRGDPAMRTAFSPTGVEGRGTINNCALGYTQWGTYLTCEENWAGYFTRPSSDDANRSARELTAIRRYGLTRTRGNYGWSTATDEQGQTIFRRWDARVTGADATEDFRNEFNTFGWVVEIDPYDKSVRPKKRTTLGRFVHEGAWPGRFIAGQRVALYMGDDARDEYFYKFVSNTPWNPADARAANRMAIGDKYLDAGTLYVARFNSDGTGTWLPLVMGQVPNRPARGSDPEYAFADQADILRHARLAADAVGATPMDRPEWTATSNATGEIYLTLTNTNATARPLDQTDAANPRHYNDPRQNADGTFRANFGNPNGHIIRVREAGDNQEATTFVWDIYLFGAGADLDPNNINISGLTAENDFSSPDGIWFSRASNPSGAGNRQLLWIQTDDGAYTDVTNNQMLAALPGNVRDGGPLTITNQNAAGARRQQMTLAGADATPATLRRFTVGPLGCEVTGVDSTPDGRSLFYNIQHPNGAWPSTQGSGPGPRPRSATVVVTKNDGGVVGL